MTQTEGFKSRKYGLKMKDTYNELLRSCATEKTVKELGMILNKTNTHILNYIKTLEMNGHVEKNVLASNIGLIKIKSLSKFVPENEFASEYKPRSRRTTTEEPQLYKWLGNPFRETI